MSKWRLEFQPGIAEHERIARSQKDFLSEVADKIKSGEPLSEIEREWAAGAIRAFADSIPLSPKRKQGPAPKFCHATAAVNYAMLRVSGKGHNATITKIARSLGVTRRAVRVAVEENRKGAFGVIFAKDPDLTSDSRFAEAKRNAKQYWLPISENSTVLLTPKL